MKKIFLALSVTLALAACSGADTTPSESEATVLPAETGEPSLSSDPLMAEGDALPPPEGSLSTPVEPPPAPEVPPVPDLAESSSTETSASTDTATASSTETAVSEPVPPPSTPSTPSAEALPPVVAGAGATKPDRNVYQDYREYQDRVKTRAQSESELEVRSLFPHEDGAFQLGLDYIYKPFDGYDFDPGTAIRTAESQGGALSFNYFPLRSLSYGRLGVGAQVAAYWTKYEHTLGTVTDTNSKHSIDTYGARLIYEFQYFLGQLVVPHAFYAYDQVRVRPYTYAQAGVSYPGTRFNSQSYGGGLHLNLNRLESKAASRALATSGIRKFYLSYTYLQRAENTGSSHYLGLKFEY
jgi:hypothetical protein